MSKQPNFLVIMSDQHAANAIGACGHPVVQTPVLDRLASESVTFANAYAAYPMCTPARMSFMTGQYTPQHRVWELGDPLSSALPTWAHALQMAGYETALAGRMHFIGDDQLHGFARRSHSDVSDYATHPPAPGYATHPPVYAYGYWDDDPRRGEMLRAVAAAGPTDGETKYQRYDRNVCDTAIKELHELSSRRAEQPWALTVGLMLPHFPFQVSRPYYDLYRDADIPQPAAPPDGRSFEECLPPMFQGIRRFLGLSSDGLSAEQVREARRCYYGMISFMDEQIGRLLQTLEQLDMDEDTYVVYLSDHGESLGEHGLWSKMTFFEESVRIPWMIRHPDHAGAGRTCTAPISQVDWLPTLLDITGQLPWLEPLPGQSLLPLIDNPVETWPERSVLSDYACAGVRTPLRMVRRGQWKACFGAGLPPALYDLQADPHEWRNRAGDPDLQPVLDELSAAARADGWDPAALQAEILTHQRRLHYLARVHSQAG